MRRRRYNEERIVQITVDDQTYQCSGPEDQTLHQLVDEICGEPTAPTARLVVEVACNGKTVADEELDAALNAPLHTFENIDLRTVGVRAQVSATLSQAVHVLQQAPQTCNAAADALDQGRHETAMTELQRLLEIVRQAQQTMLLSAHLLGVDLEHITAGDRNLMDLLALIKTRLEELKNGMENQDFVAVSDLLRYEFTEPLNLWIDILRQLGESVRLD